MIPVEIDQDEYLTVFNSENTYKCLVDRLKYSYPIIFAWTDQEGTQLDILLVYKPRQYGNLQRGMHAATDLFVAVTGFGMFGFELNGIEKAPSYVGDKLGLGGTNTTTEKLAELINGVCRELEL
jgi:hypothetical protein